MPIALAEQGDLFFCNSKPLIPSQNKAFVYKKELLKRENILQLNSYSTDQ